MNGVAWRSFEVALAVLDNRPAQASEQLEALQRLFLDAGWNPWQAAATADEASVRILCWWP